jgi:tRNA threonylcarbamoyladenosine biosynthesis protein TsaB
VPTKGYWPRSPAMLTLAFDTATSAATSALVRGEEVLAEGVSRAVRVLADAEELLEQAGAKPSDVRRLVVGTGPGSFTGVRMGLAAARSLAFALDLPLAGVSTLHALAAGAQGSLPVIDAGRREVFTLRGGDPVVVAPGELRVEAGTVCVGDGAVRYREVLEALGAEVPPRESELHLPKARFHARLATDFVPPDEVEPLYLRLPDAEQKR